MHSRRIVNRIYILMVFPSVLWAAIWTLSSFGLGTEEEGSEFSYEISPSKAVLALCAPRTGGGAGGMTVYGDGSVELFDQEDDGRVDRFSVALTQEEVESLIELALNYGIAEYNSGRAHDLMLANGRPFPRTDGSSATTVLLSLVRHRNTSGVTENIEKTIRINSVEQQASEFPEISALKGIVRLTERMRDLISQAKSSASASYVAPDFSSVDFAFLRDPHEVILSVRSREGLRRQEVIWEVFGDGSAIILVKAGDQVLERYDIQSAQSEAEALIELAVSHGLVEFDNTSIRARQLQRLACRHYSAPEDGSKLVVFLSLTSYQRASYSREEVDVTIQAESPRIAAEVFPDIPELQALAEFQSRLLDILSVARASKRSAR